MFGHQTIRLFYGFPLPREKCQSDACARPCVISKRTSKKLTRIINSVTSLLFLYSSPPPHPSHGLARTRRLCRADEFLRRNRPRGRIPSSTRRWTGDETSFTPHRNAIDDLRESQNNTIDGRPAKCARRTFEPGFCPLPRPSYRYGLFMVKRVRRSHISSNSYWGGGNTIKLFAIGRNTSGTRSNSPVDAFLMFYFPPENSGYPTRNNGRIVRSIVIWIVNANRNERVNGAARSYPPLSDI